MKPNLKRTITRFISSSNWQKETFQLKDRRGDSGDDNERNEDDLKYSMVDVRKKSV